MSITCNRQYQHYNEGSIFIDVRPFLLWTMFSWWNASFFSVWLQFSWSFFETCVSFYPLHILFLEPLHSAQPSSSHSLAYDCRSSCLSTIQLNQCVQNLGGGGGWLGVVPMIIFWMCSSGLSKPLPHYSLLIFVDSCRPHLSHFWENVIFSCSWR